MLIIRFLFSSFDHYLKINKTFQLILYTYYDSKMNNYCKERYNTRNIFDKSLPVSIKFNIKIVVWELTVKFQKLRHCTIWKKNIWLNIETIQWHIGRSPLPGFLIHPVIQQIKQQIKSEPLSGGEGLLYDFSRSKCDLYNISCTVHVHCTDVAALTNLLFGVNSRLCARGDHISGGEVTLLWWSYCYFQFSVGELVLTDLGGSPGRYLELILLYEPHSQIRSEEAPYRKLSK